jgi:hypothetical protein
VSTFSFKHTGLKSTFHNRDPKFLGRAILKSLCYGVNRFVGFGRAGFRRGSITNKALYI